MKTHAILGFDGGKCKELAGNAIHIPIDNMQVAENFQMMIGHILMLDLKGRN
jgi:D-sedoheptulose 7-phosphate isomerase